MALPFLLLLISTQCQLDTATALPRQDLARQGRYFPDYNYYHNFSHIYATIQRITERHSLFFQLDNSYTSRQGHSQLLLHVSNFTLRSPKVKVLLSYGEHAREFFPIESLFHFLTNLTEGLSAQVGSPAEKFSRFVLTNVDLYIVPLLNPDGRLLVERTQNYCWRGTSTGVDLNRNFDWNFGGKGSSYIPGNDELRGPHAFSEPECQVLTQLTQIHQFDAFISFHSGIQEIYLPFADSNSKVHPRELPNYPMMLDLARHLSHSTGLRFNYGQATRISSYPADGTIFDFMAGIKKVPFSLAIELWGDGDLPGKECFDLFNPPNNELQQNLKSVHPLYATLFTYLVSWKQQSNHSSLSLENEGPSLTLGLLLLGSLVVVVLWFLLNRKLPEFLQVHSPYYHRRRIVSLKSLSSSLHRS